MKILAFLAVLLLLLVSGCTTAPYNTTHVNQTNSGTQADAPEQNHPSVLTKRLPEGVHISIADVALEKHLYHSAEVLRFNISVNSNADLEDLGISAEGISGKMLIDRKVNLTPGENVVEFEYGLPRCNVCGGIRPGNHTIDIKLYYGVILDTARVSVEIQQ